ncbi:DUF285 domain-containing protein, partial [Enterococcus sp. S181_ASV_20]|nr:DUF285 domain-containing protein [Enterococcus sp. S181_ASV_20]
MFGNADTSKITDVSNVFENCKNLETVDISKWDTSNIEYFNRMFSGCHKLTEINFCLLYTSDAADEVGCVDL